MGTLLKNGWVLQQHQSQQQDILIKDGYIQTMAADIPEGTHDVIDVHGRWVTPGFVDVHVHLREPGAEDKETIATGSRAAAKGGFTTIAPMPNTSPVPDNPDVLAAIQDKMADDGVVRLLPYAAITAAENGQDLVDVAGLAKGGCFAFSDDGVGVQNAGMMLEAMKQATAAGKAVVAHCEDNTLIQGGCVHEGSFAEAHQLPGIPSVCESVQIARDVLLAEAAGAHYHVCHVSTKESVRVIRDAKQAGIHVTAEVTPHHLLLADHDIPAVDTYYKMNPPLRAGSDRQALIDGLLDGTIDCIATDHAPHTVSDKSQGMQASPFGIVGLETAFPLLYTHFVKTNIFSLQQLIGFLTAQPAHIFDLPYGWLQEGAPADICVLDLDKKQAVKPDRFASKGRNTPFADWQAEGWPALTIVAGKVVFAGDAYESFKV